MKQLTVTLKDNTSHSIAAGLPAVEMLKDFKDIKNPVAVKIDDIARDLHTVIDHDAHIEFVAADSAEGLQIVRHSTAHLMAHAVKTLFPQVQVTIGPSIDDGFYYDFDTPEPFTPSDLEKIEETMRALIKQNIPIRRKEMSRDDALKLFNDKGETYKIELINELPSGETISVYEQGDFIDLCLGPHLPSTGKIRAFKLTSLAGAYWRGSEKNKMLQRIYGTAFADKKALKAHLQLIEEAKKRDHRKLGRELDLFNIYDEAGAGLIVYHPKGALLRRIIEDFEIKQHLRRGYQLVKGPQILKLELWEKSGHLDNYRENMYFTEVDEKQYGLKPMNCLAHMLIYNSTRRSYKELPLRYFELGTVNRHEKSGVLHGLTRVREFTQDDAHILCTPEQLNQEILNIIQFITDVMDVFDFKFEVELSTRPVKSIGTDLDWQRATEALESASKTTNLTYEINAGDGAFYGPKIDFKLQDSLKRSWQCATIQCDFVLPERFDLSYIGSDGEKHRPVMLHRVILGSLERFIGILIEHYAGAFPAWLAPVQAKIITISDEQHAYARDVHAQLLSRDIRAELDLRNESLNFKIREAQVQKIPYMLVIGNNEIEAGGIAPRTRKGKNLGCMPVADFAALLQQDCSSALKNLT
jgi:threonyl-tRNA synthetase